MRYFNSDNPIKPIPSADLEMRIANSLEVFNKDFPLVFLYMTNTGLPYDRLRSLTKNELISYTPHIKNTDKVISLPDDLKSRLEDYPSDMNEAPFRNIPQRHPFIYALEKISPLVNANPVITPYTTRKTFIYHLYCEGFSIYSLSSICRVRSNEDLNHFLHLGEQYMGETICTVFREGFYDESQKKALSVRLSEINSLLTGNSSEPPAAFLNSLDKCLKKYGY